jgi:hypothetical protein
MKLCWRLAILAGTENGGTTVITIGKEAFFITKVQRYKEAERLGILGIFPFTNYL